MRVERVCGGVEWTCQFFVGIYFGICFRIRLRNFGIFFRIYIGIFFGIYIGILFGIYYRIYYRFHYRFHYRTQHRYSPSSPSLSAGSSLDAGYASLPTLNVAFSSHCHLVRPQTRRRLGRARTRRLPSPQPVLARAARSLSSPSFILALSHLLDTAAGKFTALAEEMARGSFAKRRVDWAGPSGRQLLRSRADYATVQREMGCADTAVRELSAAEAAEEAAAINGDVYSFVAEIVATEETCECRRSVSCWWTVA